MGKLGLRFFRAAIVSVLAVSGSFGAHGSPGSRAVSFRQACVNRATAAATLVGSRRWPMGRKAQRTPSPKLARLRDAVGQWRAAGGGRGSRIPESMWNEAVRLARIDGVWWTAHVLRFKYESLKLRVEVDRRRDRENAAARTGAHAGVLVAVDSKSIGEEQTQTRGRPRRARPSQSTTRSLSSNGFVALPTLVGAPSGAASASPTTGPVIEVEDGTGTRLVVRLAKDARVDVTALISAFRRRHCGA